ncbi:MAG: tetratricopeptide repeat protein [Betaproteobacteria bacterium]|nr:tetratricopeptide repeat protein [Betaproteobacteria bacterium]
MTDKKVIIDKIASSARRKEPLMEHTLDQAVAYAKGIHQKGECEKAIHIYRRVLERNPEHVEALTYLGVAYWQTNKLEKAKNFLEKAVQVAPRSQSALANLASVSSALGNHEKALQCYDRLVHLRPKFVIAHYNRGMVLKRLNRLVEAKKCFLYAITLTENSCEAGFGTNAETSKLRGELLDELFRVLHALGARARITDLFRQYSKEMFPIVDPEFDNRYLQGLDATFTAPAPLRRRNRFHFLIKQLENVLGLSGLIAECGCFRGLSSYLLCHRLLQHDSSFTGAGYQIFDSFAGLSQPSESDIFFLDETDTVTRPDSNQVAVGKYAAKLEDVKHSLYQFPEIEYFPGWIPTAFPKSKKKRYRLVHVDVDLYQPTKDCFEYFWPRLVPGGVIVCDDYNWPGAERAVKEFCQSVGTSYDVSPYGQACFQTLRAV